MKPPKQPQKSQTAEEKARWRGEALDWLKSADGDHSLIAIGKAREALRHERDAKTVQERDAAQQNAMEAEGTLEKELGLTSMRQRRMATAGLDKAPGSAVADNAFDEMVKRVEADEPEALEAANLALGRFAYDRQAELGNLIASLAAHEARLASKGFAGLLAAVSKQGRDGKGGSARQSLSEDTACRLGYTVGVMGCKNRVPHKFWVLGARFNNLRSNNPKERVQKAFSIRPNTLRDWCAPGGAFHEHYKMCVAEGEAAAKAGTIDDNRMIP